MGKSTRGRVKDRKDFSALLQSMREEAPPPSEESPPPKKKQRPLISSERQKLMSNPEIRFGILNRYIHDKSCNVLRYAPDKSIQWTATYDPQFIACPQCELKAYLRLGAKDPFRLSDYQNLYEEFHFHQKELRRIYIEESMKTELIGSDTLKVWGKEDIWLIRRSPQTEWVLELFHNNYKSKWNGTREFVPGFHPQASGNSRKYILDIIASYTYDGHKAAMQRKHEREVLLTQLATRVDFSADSFPEQRPSLFARLWTWFKRLLHI